jgi:hypothetical protein
LQSSYQRIDANAVRGAQVVGISGRMPADRTIRLWSIAALFASAFVLSGCSTQIADMPGVGLPAGAPERPKEAGGYLPVHDLPPERNEEAMKPAELAKIQSELTAARDRQATAATPAKPAKK